MLDEMMMDEMMLDEMLLDEMLCYLSDEEISPLLHGFFKFATAWNRFDG